MHILIGDLLAAIDAIDTELEHNPKGEFIAVADGRDVDCGVIHSIVIRPEPDKEGHDYFCCLGHDPDGDGVDPVVRNIASLMNSAPQVLRIARDMLVVADRIVRGYNMRTDLDENEAASLCAYEGWIEAIECLLMPIFQEYSDLPMVASLLDADAPPVIGEGE